MRARIAADMKVYQDIVVLEVVAELAKGTHAELFEMAWADQARAGGRIANHEGIRADCQQLFCLPNVGLDQHVQHGSNEVRAIMKINVGLFPASQSRRTSPKYARGAPAAKRCGIRAPSAANHLYGLIGERRQCLWSNIFPGVLPSLYRGRRAIKHSITSSVQINLAGTLPRFGIENDQIVAAPSHLEGLGLKKKAQPVTLNVFNQSDDVIKDRGRFLEAAFHAFDPIQPSSSA